MACILTIAFFKDYLNQYRAKHPIKNLSPIKVWALRFIDIVLIPIALVISFFMAVYWATDVFNLSGLTWDLIRDNFIDSTNIKISVYAIAVVTILWFVFNYLNLTIRDAIKLYLKRNDPSTAEARATMYIKCLTGCYLGVHGY